MNNMMKNFMGGFGGFGRMGRDPFGDDFFSGFGGGMSGGHGISKSVSTIIR